MHDHAMVQIMQHPQPVWGDRGDLEIDLEIPGVDDALERLVVRRLSENEYEVCCLPFALYHFGLGDTIRVEGLPRESPGRVAEVVQRLDGHVYRVLVSDPEAEAPAHEVVQSMASGLVSMGFLIEVWSPLMLVIRTDGQHSGETVRAYLDQVAWDYEVVHQPE